MWPLRRNTNHADLKVIEDKLKPTRFDRFKTSALNLASDVNVAVTQFRCSRLARQLKRNKALANAAKEALR